MGQCVRVLSSFNQCLSIQLIAIDELSLPSISYISCHAQNCDYNTDDTDDGQPEPEQDVQNNCLLVPFLIVSMIKLLNLLVFFPDCTDGMRECCSKSCMKSHLFDYLILYIDL